MRIALFFLVVIIGLVIAGSISVKREVGEEVVSDAVTEGSEDFVPTEEILPVAENLSVPWSIAFLPSGEILVTEREGALLVLGEERQEISVPGVSERGEGGLLGLALHPNFPENRFLYLYLTTTERGGTTNKVLRFFFEDNSLKEPYTIIDNIPGGLFHNGGRIAFGPDGLLYITTGDAGDGENAQEKRSLAGKILRLTDDGKIPQDNPFGNAVYSYGHRNPQGLAWDNEGGLWATEHGRSGILSGFDEVNFIEKGANYGWPEIQGDEVKEGMKKPVIHSGPSTTWAPAGMAFLSGKLYFAGLRGETLYEVPVLGANTLGEVVEHFPGKFGRLREVGEKDGYLYLSTSNTDGRGNPNDGDDKIIKINFRTTLSDNGYTDEARRDLIVVTSPSPGDEITSPLVVEGRARGYWFFEASFPLILTDWDGKIIAESYATAEDSWMTEDFVSFTGSIEFETPEYGERGTLILRKDNPSGLPEHDDALEMTVRFQ